MMKVQIGCLLLIGILTFTSITVLGNETVKNQNVLGNSAARNADFNFAALAVNMDYCSVDLSDPTSNLNVRTWEGRVVGRLRHGTQVWVSDYSGDWAKISVKRGRRWVSVGWVDSNYLLC